MQIERLSENEVVTLTDLSVKGICILFLPMSFYLCIFQHLAMKYDYLLNIIL